MTVTITYWVAAEAGAQADGDPVTVMYWVDAGQAIDTDTVFGVSLAVADAVDDGRQLE